jgi:hypothetical protein
MRVSIAASCGCIKAGTRNGIIENQKTTIVIIMAIMILSLLLGRRDSGVVRPIVAAKHRTTKRVLPPSIHEKGGEKASESVHLAMTSTQITKTGAKYPSIQ